MQRFVGSCKKLGEIDTSKVCAWIGAIAFEDWPQQHRLLDGNIRPAMVTDPAWHGFGQVVAGMVDELMLCYFPNCAAYQSMLSVVMPGHAIEPHRDSQASYWLARVHVPLTTNHKSKFIVGGVEHHLEVGNAYKVNTEAEHAVTNDGTSPRIHFMFDVRGT